MGPLEMGVKNGTITSLRQLRQLYRRLAWKWHPDSGSPDASGESFDKHTQDFDSAIAALDAEQVNLSRKPDPCACIDAFADLISSDRIGAEVWKSSRRAAIIREMFIEEVKLYPDGADLFQRFEEDLVDLRKAGIIWNPLLGKIKLILLNISGVAWNSQFSIRAIDRWISELAGERNSGWRMDQTEQQELEGHGNVVPFLRFIVRIARECSS